MTGTARVNQSDLRELLRKTDQADKETRRRVRKQVRESAKPVLTAARAKFAPVDARSAAKYGISVRKAGTVAVEQRLRRSADEAMRRPNFGAMQMRRALVPALEENTAEVVSDLNRVLAGVEADWGRGG